MTNVQGWEIEIQGIKKLFSLELPNLLNYGHRAFVLDSFRTKGVKILDLFKINGSHFSNESDV